MKTSLNSTLNVKPTDVRWYSRQSIIMTMIILLFPILFYRCSEDSGLSSEDSPTVTNRTCEAGSYSIDNGRIVFDDSTEFQQTLEFLSCASVNDIEEWADEIEIETAGKAYREIVDLLYDDELSDLEFSGYLEEYEDKVSVTQVYEDGTTSYNIQPLFPYLSEIFNLDGEFQIDTSVYKLAGNNFVSIVSPTLVPPSSVDDETETDTINKVFAHPFVVTVAQGGCCPVNDVETHHYGSNPRKRLRVDYYVVDLNIVQPVSINGLYIIRAGIGIDVKAKSQKRRGFIITWWRCHNANLSFEFDMTILHNLSNWGIANPVEFTMSRNASSICEIHQGDGRFGFSFIGFANQAPPPLSVCVDEVFEQLINTSETSAPTVTIDCN